MEKTTIKCVWEHNGNDTILYATNFVGAYTRGASLEEAKTKMPAEIVAYSNWKGIAAPHSFDIEIVQEKASDLNISDADSDVLFDTEKDELSREEYEELKALTMKSARDFLTLYLTIPNKDKSNLPARTTFYGQIPRTANEMYEHTKNVNDYYFGEIGVLADNDGTISECRKRGFELLESKADFLKNEVLDGSYGEEWSLRKLLRRFIWHDRIHAKAMYRMALKTFGRDAVPDVFKFGI